MSEVKMMCFLGKGKPRAYVCFGGDAPACALPLLFLLFLCIISSLHADTLTLKSGSKLEGHILSETDIQVVISVNGMDLPIQRSKIEKIEKGEMFSENEISGDKLVDEQKFDEALKAYQKALAAETIDESKTRLNKKIEKVNAELSEREDLRFGAKFKQVQTYITQRDFDNAEKLLLSILEENPSEQTVNRVNQQLARIKYSLALKSINLVDYAKAHELLEQAIKYYPDYIDAHKKRAELLEQKTATYDQALDAYQRVWDLGRDKMGSKDLCEVAYRLGNLSRELKEWESALDYFEVILEKCEEDYYDIRDLTVECHVEIAQKFYNKDDALSKQNLETALVIKPFDDNVRLLLARLCLHMKEWQEAVDNYEKVIKNGLVEENMYYELGFCYRKVGNAKSAETAMTRELNLYPNNVDATIALGELLLDGGKNSEALERFTQAQQLDAGNFRASLGKGRVLRMLKRFDDAKAELNRALESDPESYEVNFELGMIYKEMEEFEEAKDFFNKVIDRFDDSRLNPETRRMLAEAYIWRGDSNRQLQLFQTAINDIRKSLEIRPNNANAYFEMGEAYRSLEKYDKAEEYYKKALEINPNELDYYLALAFLHHQNYKNMEEACKYYNEYINRGGKRENVSRFLDELNC